MHPILFEVFGFPIRVYSLMYLIGVILSMIFAGRCAVRLGYKKTMLEDAVVFGFIGGLIVARAYYVIFDFDSYKDNIWEIVAIWHGGLAIHGGIIGGILGLYVYSRYKKIPLLLLMDIIAPFLLLSQIFGRIGNIANGEAQGVPVITPPSIIFDLKNNFLAFWSEALKQMRVENTPEALSNIPSIIASNGGAFNVTFMGHSYVLKDYVPWGMSFPSTFGAQVYQMFGTLPVHPTSIYEMLINSFFFILIIVFLWNKDKYIGTGIISGCYMISYAISRGFVTMFRSDDLMLGLVRVPHIASLVLILAGVCLILMGKKKMGISKNV